MEIAADAAGIPRFRGKTCDACQPVRAAEGTGVTTSRREEFRAQQRPDTRKAGEYPGVLGVAEPVLDQRVQFSQLALERSQCL